MNPEAVGRTPTRVWVGRILSAIPAFFMLLSGTMKLIHPTSVVAAFTTQFGYPESAIVPIGLIEIACVIIYLIPRTAVLGAILVSSYLGGAVATHFRIQDPTGIAPFILGILAWGGLYFRDARLTHLLPFRKTET